MRGMQAAVDALNAGYGQAAGALSPYSQRGLGYLDAYSQMAMNPNLDAIRREREDATNNLNAQLSGMGMSRSGFAAKSHAGLQADYASRMFDARMRAMQPLLGVGPAAAGGLAGAAGEFARGLGSVYQGGYGAYAGGLAQQGQLAAQGAMAPYQTWNSLLPVAGAVAGGALGGAGGAVAGGAVGGSLVNQNNQPGGYAYGGAGNYTGAQFAPPRRG
jgi:hypothetical protein